MQKGDRVKVAYWMPWMGDYGITADSRGTIAAKEPMGQDEVITVNFDCGERVSFWAHQLAICAEPKDHNHRLTSIFK